MSYRKKVSYFYDRMNALLFDFSKLITCYFFNFTRSSLFLFLTRDIRLETLFFFHTLLPRTLIILHFPFILNLADVGIYLYSIGHPMKPHRMRIIQSLLLNYGVTDKMSIYVFLKLILFQCFF